MAAENVGNYNMKGACARAHACESMRHRRSIAGAAAAVQSQHCAAGTLSNNVYSAGKQAHKFNSHGQARTSEWEERPAEHRLPSASARPSLLPRQAASSPPMTSPSRRNSSSSSSLQLG